MFAKALAGAALVISASISPGAIAPGGNDTPVRLSAQQKQAIIQPLIRSATDCVARAVAADPRLGQSKLNDLIVESFSSCVDPVRALIGAHDRYYGAGTGEKFFMGPYLDRLPAAVTGLVGEER